MLYSYFINFILFIVWALRAKSKYILYKKIYLSYVSDTVAMTILALRCIVKDHRHRNLQHSLRRPTINLARQQQPDGGFGNVFNTALTMQVH